MANTIKLATRLQFARDSVTVVNPPLKEVETSTASELRTDNVQVVGTTHELFAVGDVTDSAFCMIENLHTTATVSVGGDSAGSFVAWFDVPAGERAVLPRVSSLAASYLKSSAASTPVQVTLIKVS